MRGLQNLCLALRGLFAFVSDGGFAEYVTVPAYCLVRLPPQLSFDVAAPLCCSAATALHAVTVAGVEAGETVVVYGVGGVGLNLVQVAAKRGARVMAVGRTPAKLQAARELGADQALQPDEAAAAVADAGGADAVFELVGNAESMPKAMKMLGRRGRLVFIGYSSDTLDVRPLGLVVDEQRILTSVGNTLAELEIAVDLAARGDLQTLLDSTVDLADINAALNRLRKGEVVGRLIVHP